MKETVPIDEKDFNQLFRIRKFEEMTDDELANIRNRAKFAEL